MDLISTASFKGRLGHIKRGQEFKADPEYAKELVEVKKLAVYATQNKTKGDAPKNKNAGANASSSPAGRASQNKTQNKQNS